MPAADFMILWCIFVVQRFTRESNEVFSQTDIGRQRDESSQVLTRLRFVGLCGDLPFYLSANLTTMQRPKNDQPIAADNVTQKLSKAYQHLFNSKKGGCYGIA